MGGNGGLSLSHYRRSVFGRLSAESASMPEDYMVHICDGGLSDSQIIWQTSYLCCWDFFILKRKEKKSNVRSRYHSIVECNLKKNGKC